MVTAKTTTKNLTRVFWAALLSLVMLTVLVLLRPFGAQAAAPKTMTVSIDDWTYGDEGLPKLQVNLDPAKDYFYVVWAYKAVDSYGVIDTIYQSTALPNGAGVGETDAANWSAGQYRVIVYANGYTAGICDFEIHRKPVTGIQPVVTIDGQPVKQNETVEWTYDGTNHYVHITPDTGDQHFAMDVYNVQWGTHYSSSGSINPAIYGVGDYIITARASDGSNYDLGTYTYTARVLPAENPFYNIAGEGKNLQEEDIVIDVPYGDTRLIQFGLKDVGVPGFDPDDSLFVGDVDITYSMDYGATWTYVAPTAKLAPGRHDIMYRVKINNFEEKIETVHFNIQQVEIPAADIVWPSVTEYTYTGKEIDLAPYYNGIRLATDKVVKNVGEYELIATLSDVYAGGYKITGVQVPQTYTVKPAPVLLRTFSKSITFGDDPANGGYYFELLPDSSYFALADIEQFLLANGEITFTYNYTKGDDAGSYFITPVYTWKGAAGVAENFSVTAIGADLYVAKKTVEIDWSVLNETPVYDGEVHAITASFTDLEGNEVALIVTTATPFRDAGTYRAFAVLPEDYADNYQLPVDYSEKSYTIAPAPLAKPTPTEIFHYTGEPQTFDIPESDYYTVVNGVRTNIGQHTVTVKLKDFNHVWEDGTRDNLSYEFVMNKAQYDMTGVSFENVKIVRGQTFVPALTGTLPTGVDGSQPTVQFLNCDKTAVGTYTITAHFTTASAYYEAPQDLTAKLTIESNTGRYNMSGVTFPDITIYFGQSYKAAIQGTLPTGPDGSHLTVSYVNCTQTAVGEYTMRAVFATDSLLYTAPSAMTAKLTILSNEGQYDLSGVTFPDMTIYYGQTAEPALVGDLPVGPDGSHLSVTFEGYEETAVGEYTVTAVFTTDSTILVAPDPITATLSILSNEGQYDLSGVSFRDQTIYFGQTVTPTLVGELPVGPDGSHLTVTYEGFEETAVGEYTVTAVFTTDSEILVAPDPITAKFTILSNVGQYDLSGVTFPDINVILGQEVKPALVGNLPVGPDGSHLSVTFENHVQTVPGTYTVTAVFTTDSAVLVAPDPITATLTVEPNTGRYDLSGVTFPDIWVILGQPVAPALVGELPVGPDGSHLTVTFENYAQTEPGTYTVKAVFTTDSAVLVAPDPITATLTVEPNTDRYDLSGVTFPDITVAAGQTVTPALVGELPIGPDGSHLSVTFENFEQTAPGKYTITAVFTTDSECLVAPAPMTATLTVTWVEQVITDDSGNEMVKTVSETGMDPDVKVVVTTVEIDKEEELEPIIEILEKDEHFGKNDGVFGVYDVSFEKGNVKVQPDGMLDIYLTVPEKLLNADYRIFHIHNGEVIDMEYTKDGKYAVIRTDKLSEFAFVYEQTSLMWLIVLLAIVSAVLLVLLVLQLIALLKKGALASGKAMALAAPVFFLPGHVSAVITLGIVAGVILIANVVVFLLRRKKASAKNN